MPVSNPDPGLTALSRNNDYLSQNYETLREKYGGKHIAISSGEEVITGETVSEVIEKIEKKDIDFEEVTIEYMPEKGEVILF